MYQQETIKPYNSGDKAQQVEQMFDNIAPTYDTLNHRLSWDIDKGWRRKAIRQLLPSSKKNLIKEYPGLNHLFQHCTTGLVAEYSQIEETISPEVLSDIANWINSLK